MRPHAASRADRAAALVAEDALTDAQIAEAVGIAKATLERWKRRPEFQASVDAIRSRTRAALIRRGIAERQNRVDVLDDLLGRMRGVVAARAIEHAAVPGGDTGMLVRTARLVKVYAAEPRTAPPDGPDAEGGPSEPEPLSSARREVLVSEYAVDTGLVAEIRAYLKQGAQEVGQWTEKQEHSGEIGIRRYEGVNLEAV
jgi:hypothetical protein